MRSKPECSVHEADDALAWREEGGTRGPNRFILPLQWLILRSATPP